MNKSAHWRKLGLILEPRRDLWWWRTHSMVPTPHMLGGSHCRLYFSGRDDKNRSHIGWALLDLDREGEIIETSVEPVLSPGELGCFDDNGVTPSCLLEAEGHLHLYYIGWNPGSTTRMNIFGGLAISKDGGKTFERWSRAPVLERCPSDPYINTAPFVIPTGEGYRVYYVSAVGWDDADSPRYLIKTGTSSDAKNFERDGTVCIDFAGPRETALARPYVLYEDGTYKMWFSHKCKAYRFAYAESQDGVSWERLPDPSGLDVSSGNFDSEMIEYAAIVRCGSRSFMFYNGNAYGADGVGLAVSE